MKHFYNSKTHEWDFEEEQRNATKDIPQSEIDEANRQHNAQFEAQDAYWQRRIAIEKFRSETK